MPDYAELYESLTQAERIVWDVAEGLFVRWDNDFEHGWICPCGMRTWGGIEALVKIHELDGHEDDCPYRRASEWWARKVAEWEAGR